MEPVEDGQPEQTHRRLGIRQLGIHAYERRMPKRLHALLSKDDTVQHGRDRVVLALKYLLTHDDATASARLCDPAVQYIGKLKHGIWGEGHNFCGYHNLQMQISYLISHQPQSQPAFEHGIPSIPCLQTLIEDAWDKGINAYARVQTGGILGTRKHIGTLEVQAVIQSLGIATTANTFSSLQRADTPFDQLLQYVDQYFAPGEQAEDPSDRVVCTARPPVYLQRPGHSITIVGIETRVSGEKLLLVFDPALKIPEGLREVAEHKMESRAYNRMLTPFRRGAQQMRRFAGFETLHLA